MRLNNVNTVIHCSPSTSQSVVTLGSDTEPKSAPSDDEFLILSRPVLKKELRVTPGALGQSGHALQPGHQYMLRWLKLTSFRRHILGITL